MNIGIIGANGFVGAKLCSAQLHAGNSVFAICNNNIDLVPHACVIVALEEAEKIYFDQLFITIGSHASSHTEFIKQNSFLIKVISSLNFSRIIFISSIAVYGNHTSTIHIDSCYSNPSLYGNAKLAQEFIIKSCNDYVIIRPTYIYGVGMRDNSLLPAWIKSAIAKSTITVFGDGERKQDYLHVNDLVNLCILAGNKGGNCTVIAATGTSYNNKIIAEKIAELIPGTSILHLGEDVSPSFLFDISQTIELFKWHSISNFENELNNYIQHENFDI